MDHTELNEILEKHKEWLEGGEDGEKADLSYIDLRNLNFEGVTLTFAKLMGVDLSGVNLRNANLRGANLIEADLTSANFENADLRGAYLNAACLVNADFTKAQIKGTNFEGADLEGANLEKATIRPKNDNRAKIQSQSRVSPLFMKQYKKFIGDHFSEYDFEGAIFAPGWKITRITENEKRKITQDELDKILDLHEIVSKARYMTDLVKGKPARLENYDLRGLNFSNRNLKFIRLKSCYLNYANFINCNLHKADLYNSCCRYANFTNAKMTIANIRYANFEKAIFNKARLTCNDVKNKYLITMKYPQDILTKEQIDSAFVIDRRGRKAN